MGVPKFRDYRRTADGVMVADVGFKKQLWALDPELDVVWDWASCKWEIWKFPGQSGRKRKRVDPRAYHIMTIQTNKKTFRELGADILLKLQLGDTHKYSLKQLVDYFDKIDNNIMRAKEKAFKDHIEAISLDTFDYARGVLKVPVPRAYAVKPSEKKYLLNVSPTSPGYHMFKRPAATKLENVLGGN
jgi:hypothetical protein